MHRGTLIAINNDKVLISQEFNGRMGLDNYGKEVFNELKNIKNLEDFEFFVSKFNKEHFEYEENNIVREADSKDKPYKDDNGNFWYEYEKKGNTYDFFRNSYPMSDNYYIKNLSDNNVKIVCENGSYTLKPNQILVSDFDRCINNTGKSFDHIVDVELDTLERKNTNIIDKENNLLLASKYSVLADRLEEAQKEIEEIKELDGDNFPRFLNGDDLDDVIEDMKSAIDDRCNEVYNESPAEEDEEDER